MLISGQGIIVAGMRPNAGNMLSLTAKSSGKKLTKGNPMPRAFLVLLAFTSVAIAADEPNKNHFLNTDVFELEVATIRRFPRTDRAWCTCAGRTTS